MNLYLTSFPTDIKSKFDVNVLFWLLYEYFYSIEARVLLSRCSQVLTAEDRTRREGYQWRRIGNIGDDCTRVCDLDELRGRE